MSASSRRSREATTFAVLTVAVCSFALLQSLVVPVLARVQAEFDTSQTTVTWVLTAYLLSASIATPILGRIGDAVGKRRMLVVTLAMLAVGSAMAALAPSIGWLIVARVVQGLGGGVLPLSFGIVRDEFGDRMTGVLSVLASLTAVGFGGGIVLAGPIVDHLGYAWLFWLPMIATIVAAVAAQLFVPESPVRTPGRLPIVPGLLLGAALVSLLLPVSQGRQWGWTSPGTLALLGSSIVLGAWWVRSENRAPVPLIDMKMMRLRGVWTTNLVAGFVGFGMFAAFGFLPQFLQTPQEAGYGFSATISESGHLLVPSAIASFLMGFTTARLMRRLGARLVITTGTIVSAAAFLTMAFFHDHQWQLYLATTVQGVGSGLVFLSLAGVVIASVPAHQTGVASGMNANIRTIGGSIGSAVMAGVVTAHTGVGDYPAESGYTVGFTLLAVGMLVAAAVATLMPDVHRQGTSSRLADADNAELAMIPGSPAAP